MASLDLSEDTKDYWVPRNIKYLHKPDAITFLREAVCEYQPVIITGMLEDWPAMRLWEFEYLEELIGKDRNVKINYTPDGLADCIKDVDGQQMFTYPLELEVPFGKFLDELLHPSSDDAVPYLSQQNDCFRTDYNMLSKDVLSSIPLADESFGLSAPEAINLWIGDERSISSMHKDHFENMYCIIRGEKTFTLFPPTDIVFIPEVTVPSQIYSISETHSASNTIDHLKKSDMVLSSENCPSKSLSWIPVDPNDDHSLSQYPSMRGSSPLFCTVKAGEILYLPAMWYHRVSQNCPTIGVNYWYDQRFNFRYVFFKQMKILQDQEQHQHIEDDCDFADVDVDALGENEEVFQYQQEDVNNHSSQL